LFKPISWKHYKHLYYIVVVLTGVRVLNMQTSLCETANNIKLWWPIGTCTVVELFSINSSSVKFLVQITEFKWVCHYCIEPGREATRTLWHLNTEQKSKHNSKNVLLLIIYLILYNILLGDSPSMLTVIFIFE